MDEIPQLPRLCSNSARQATLPNSLRIRIQEAKMKGMNETTILQDGNVKVTNRRLLIGTETYGISNIRSLKLKRHTRNKKPLIWIAVGILLALWGTVPEGPSIEFFNIGIVMVIEATLIFLFTKPPYTIQIETGSDKFGILNTADISLTKRIVNAMNQAIAKNRQS
jgi:hypothetical protein